MKHKELTTCWYGATRYDSPAEATQAAVRAWFTEGGACEARVGDSEIEFFHKVLQQGQWTVPNVTGPFTLPEVRTLVQNTFDAATSGTGRRSAFDFSEAATSGK